jgi:hypothetical protein
MSACSGLVHRAIHPLLGVMVVASILAAALLSACNPFAPSLESDASDSRFGDPRTIDGYFQAFRYAYQFKDTTLYGGLLAPNFVFSYRNYDRGLDLEWGREEEVRTTGSLFQAAQRLDLIWGNVLDSVGTSTSFDITRSFSLDISFNPGDVSHVDGRAVFHLERAVATDPWRAIRWRDESNL